MAEKKLLRLFPNMTREEFKINVEYNHGHTEEQLNAMGIKITECLCKHPSCPGWTLEKTEEFSMEKFNAAFT